MSSPSLPASPPSSVSTSWLQHEFYRSALVLGIDIGLEGIGVYLRRGPEELFAQAVAFDVPKAERLADRRQFRAARHCRKNRRLRLRRLDALLEKHGLPRPWLDKPEADRSTDPLRLRFRALDREQGLGSAHALAFCVRSCVSHRGYSYGGTEEGRFPWGEGTTFGRANARLANAYVTSELATELESYADELTAGKDVERSRERYLALIQERLAWSAEHDLMRVLREHHKGDKHDNLRIAARGYAFPQKIIWQHLLAIIEHHRSLITDPDGFIEALSIDPKLCTDKTSAEKARQRAIFWYQRKTPFEMEEHWASKVSLCPYTSEKKLNLLPADQRCDYRREISIRRWSMLEFASSRRVEVDAPDELPEGAPKKRSKTRLGRRLLHSLTASGIEALTKLAVEHQTNIDAGAGKEWTASVKDRAKAIVVEDIQSIYGAEAKPAPSTKGKTVLWNGTFFDQLNDLVAPSFANLSGRASLCSASAQRLYDIATADGTTFDAEEIRSRLNTAGYFDWKREPRVDANPFPQVEFLLGRRVKRGKRQGEIASSVQGFLRRLFARLLQEQRITQDAPDYCIIEVIGDPPRNLDQKAEILEAQKKRRDERIKRFEDHDLKNDGIASKRRRITLFAQQGGKCPYTGESLGEDPLSEALEIEHIFPDSMGGLSVDDNLVLTRQTTNADKNNRTPLDWKGAEGLKAMLAHTQSMRWGALKREVFAWGTRTSPSADGRWPSHFNADGSLRVPDFGNTTRVSQLARQLRVEVMRWMGVLDDFNEAARRIGTPSGWLAAQARKTWLPANDYTKDRSNQTHHLIDAAVLAHIPPGVGQNHARCGGIFYNESVLVGRTLRLMTFALSELSPAARLARWLPANGEYAECPVSRVKSRSKTKPLGDSTFWKQVDKDKPTLAQRTALDPQKFKGDAHSLHAVLRRMKIPERQIPSISVIGDWLDKATAATAKEAVSTEPLRLIDGTPVRSIWKFDGKGSLEVPLGWSGYQNDQNTLTELRNLDEKNDRLELWIGWNPKAKRWEYQKRVIPARTSLRHFQQMGFQWKAKQAGLKGKSWRQEIVGTLYPFSKRVGIFRKEDVFKLAFNADKELTLRTDEPCWTCWYRVGAVKGDVRLELVSQVFKKDGMPHGLTHKPNVGRPDDLAALLGLPVATEFAEALISQHKLQQPTPSSASSLSKCDRDTLILRVD